MLEENNVQNHQIPSDLEINLNTLVPSMTYPNIIVINDNSNPIIARDLKILRDF